MHELWYAIVVAHADRRTSSSTGSTSARARCTSSSRGPTRSDGRCSRRSGRSGTATRCGSSRRAARSSSRSPAVLASGISGFYFAIFLVLWCLILRGISIELRSHVKDTVWRKTWDTGFRRRERPPAGLLRRGAREPDPGRPARRGRVVRADPLHRLHGGAARRHPRLVHGPRRRLRARRRSSRTAGRTSRGRRTAPCRSGAAGPRGASTPGWPFSGSSSRSRPRRSTRTSWRRCRAVRWRSLFAALALAGPRRRLRRPRARAATSTPSLVLARSSRASRSRRRPASGR